MSNENGISIPYRDSELAKLQARLEAAEQEARATKGAEALARSDLLATEAKRAAEAVRANAAEAKLRNVTSWWGIATRWAGWSATAAVVVGLVVVGVNAIVQCERSRPPSAGQRDNAKVNAITYLRRVYPQAADLRAACSSSSSDEGRWWCIAIVDGRPMELRCGDGCEQAQSVRPNASPSAGQRNGNDDASRCVLAPGDCSNLGPLGWR